MTVKSFWLLFSTGNGAADEPKADKAGRFLLCAGPGVNDKTLAASDVFRPETPSWRNSTTAGMVLVGMLRQVGAQIGDQVHLPKYNVVTQVSTFECPLPVYSVYSPASVLVPL